MSGAGCKERKVLWLAFLSFLGRGFITRARALAMLRLAARSPLAATSMTSMRHVRRTLCSSSVVPSLQGKVALVTGSGSGIGRASALALAKAGCVWNKATVAGKPAGRPRRASGCTVRRRGKAALTEDYVPGPTTRVPLSTHAGGLRSGADGQERGTAAGDGRSDLGGGWPAGARGARRPDRRRRGRGALRRVRARARPARCPLQQRWHAQPTM